MQLRHPLLHEKHHRKPRPQLPQALGRHEPRELFGQIVPEQAWQSLVQGRRAPRQARPLEERSRRERGRIDLHNHNTRSRQRLESLARQRFLEGDPHVHRPEEVRGLLGVAHGVQEGTPNGSALHARGLRRRFFLPHGGWGRSVRIRLEDRRGMRGARTAGPGDEEQSEEMGQPMRHGRRDAKGVFRRQTLGPQQPKLAGSHCSHSDSSRSASSRSISRARRATS